MLYHHRGVGVGAFRQFLPDFGVTCLRRETLLTVTDENDPKRAASHALREAIVFERNEKDQAPYEAQQQAQDRIDAAHLKTLEAIRIARNSGVTKSSIAQHLGVKNVYRVNQLIKEAGVE